MKIETKSRLDWMNWRSKPPTWNGNWMQLKNWSRVSGDRRSDGAKIKKIWKAKLSTWPETVWPQVPSCLTPAASTLPSEKEWSTTTGEFTSVKRTSPWAKNSGYKNFWPMMLKFQFGPARSSLQMNSPYRTVFCRPRQPDGRYVSTLNSKPSTGSKRGIKARY